MMKRKKYDVIGIGFGPSNIAVACAMEESDFNHEVIFLEAKKEALWQENMLFDDSDIQNHPLRDLVTPRNPRSKYSFTNFLFEQNRLFEFLNTGMIFPFREEYAQYISWVASHFNDKVQYNTKVQDIRFLEDETYEVTDAKGNIYLAESIIFAPGRTPNIPKEFQHIKSDKVVFLSQYLKTLKTLDPNKIRKVAVVGGSQSAVEIILHISEYFSNTEITGFTRRFGYLQKDVNPFTGEVYFPEFVDVFYAANKLEKDRLIKDLHLTNYSASDYDVLDRLYKKMYLHKIQGKSQIKIHRSCDIIHAEEHNDQVAISFQKIENKSNKDELFDLVILATGFKNTGTKDNEERMHSLLDNVKMHFALDEDQCVTMNYDYSIQLKDSEMKPLFLNGLCESSHGMGDAGSFSLLALRSIRIVESLNKVFSKKRIPITS